MGPECREPGCSSLGLHRLGRECDPLREYGSAAEKLGYAPEGSPAGRLPGYPEKLLAKLGCSQAPLCGSRVLGQPPQLGKGVAGS